MDRPNLFSLLTLFLGLILGHWLRIGTDSAKRRREFRNFIHSVFIRFDGLHPTKFDETFDETIPLVKGACLEVFEDIRFWKRKGFIKYRDVYCSLRHPNWDLPLVSTPSGFAQAYKSTENKKKYQESLDAVKNTLDMIAKYAV